MTRKFYAYHRQKGVVLVIALIFLLVMTLIGVMAMQGTTMQERMSGNFRDRNMAFQSAEAALRAGEQEIRDEDTFAIGGPWLQESSSPVNYDASLPSGNAWEARDLLGVLGNSNSSLSTLLAQNPEFVIEPAGAYFGLNPEKQFTVAPVEFENFKVTSRGYGATENDNGIPLSQVILQTVFRTNFIGGSM